MISSNKQAPFLGTLLAIIVIMFEIYLTPVHSQNVKDSKHTDETKQTVIKGDFFITPQDPQNVDNYHIRINSQPLVEMGLPSNLTISSEPSWKTYRAEDLWQGGLGCIGCDSDHLTIWDYKDPEHQIFRTRIIEKGHVIKVTLGDVEVTSKEAILQEDIDYQVGKINQLQGQITDIYKRLMELEVGSQDGKEKPKE